jgi:hypothetical protein
MPTYEFWREIDSSEVWAVQLEDDAVTGAHGPLHWSEIIVTYLPHYEYTDEEAAEVRGRTEEFERLDTQAVLLARTSE